MNENDIQSIWKKMAMVYGHRWVAAYGETDDGSWLQALKNIPREKIRHGLTALLSRPNHWPPTLPEFIQLCFGLPDLESLTARIFCQDFSDPLALAIKRKIGSWNLNNLAEKDLRRQIAALYEPCYRDVIRQMVSPGELADESKDATILEFRKS